MVGCTPWEGRQGQENAQKILRVQQSFFEETAFFGSPTYENLIYFSFRSLLVAGVLTIAKTSGSGDRTPKTPVEKSSGWSCAVGGVTRDGPLDLVGGPPLRS